VRVCLCPWHRGAEEKVKEFLHRGGITEFVKLLTEGKEKLHPDVEVITALGEKNGVGVEVAMRWSKDQYDDLLIGFANGIRTGRRGGLGYRRHTERERRGPAARARTGATRRCWPPSG
jgi:DNA gyrase/topoisomerase IV subunit B